ncbi:MAG: hypothetical protein LBC17_01060 [Lactobacillaceae bacterium]|jgi:hypothetical protein|nr:hypothetical protein [Lactobacillaceae bacterium]
MIENNQVQITEKDVEEFKAYVEKFIKDAQAVRESKNQKTQEEPITLSSGTKLKRHIYLNGSILNYPYINLDYKDSNKGWINLYFNVKQESDLPTLFVSSSKIKNPEEFNNPLPEGFNIVGKYKIYGYEDPNPVGSLINYQGLLEAMIKLSEKEASINSNTDTKEKQENMNYKNEYTQRLFDEKNIIFHGAPGTGKTFLAYQIASDLISGGQTDKYEELDEDQKKQIDFVQFHPSYDYTDFVEGLRPSNSENGIGFELKAGTFKSFVERSKDKIFIINENGQTIEDIWNEFIESIELKGQAVQIEKFSFKTNSKGNITYTVSDRSKGSLTLDNVKYYIENNKWGEHNYHYTYKTPIFEKYIKPKIKNVTFKPNNKPICFHH